MKGTAVLAVEKDRHHIGARVTNEFGGKGRSGRVDGSASAEFPGR